MQKNIAVSILLTIVTCGIYGLFWLYSINTAAMKADSSECATDGMLVIVLAIVTGGIYTIYWQYKVGKALAAVNGGKDNSVLYLILSLCGLSIINYCLMQDDINKYMA